MAYTSALESFQIPHVLVGSRTFHQREEVETLRSALRAIEWPDDDLAVYATLKGSLFAFTDDQILEATKTSLGGSIPSDSGADARSSEQSRGAGDHASSRPVEAVGGSTPEVEEDYCWFRLCASSASCTVGRNRRAIVETVQELLGHALERMRPLRFGLQASRCCRTSIGCVTWRAATSSRVVVLFVAS